MLLTALLIDIWLRMHGRRQGVKNIILVINAVHGEQKLRVGLPSQFAMSVGVSRDS